MIIAIWYIAMTVALFVLMGYDKSRAIRKEWRVKENTLFTFAFLGGFAGGLAGMFIFRHKIRKLGFQLGFPAALLLHAVIWGYIAYTGFEMPIFVFLRDLIVL
ncbi:MAG: DUF1294 domain-containing protein [Clostridiales bacterium]|jgi:uncharacterized membrane protein YsdA (DUF1294 family)|nr:DUF1294 domain-containing protein [Clostridiales bacterium]MDR2750453.1 DUF1294 domain-containing protein [Clostridiales bacterium]